MCQEKGEKENDKTTKDRGAVKGLMIHVIHRRQYLYLINSESYILSTIEKL